MARQISGRYKVRSPDLKALHDKAQAMIARLESFSVRHVYREQNREADRLANQAMDDAERGVTPPTTAPRVVSPQASSLPRGKPLCISATFRDGVLHPHTQLPLLDDEEVELEIRRKKSVV